MAETYEELSAAVDGDGGITPISMNTLRLINGAGRLGPGVCNIISKELSQYGLGHIPEELPSYSTEEVRVYRLGTQIGDIINAIVQPSHSGDQLLRAVGGAAEGKLERIKAIVNE